jgi:hypothetical protein
MKKSDRIELAKKVLQQFKDLDLRYKIVCSFITLAPPEKIPLDMSYNIMQCNAELIDLINGECLAHQAERV